MKTYPLNKEATFWQVACNGDKSAFETVILSRYQELFQYGTRVTSDHDLVKDCIQDLFLDLWDKRKSYAGIQSPKAYLFQALRNNLIHKINRNRLLFGGEEYTDNYTDHADPESDIILWETALNDQSKLNNALDRLPSRQKEALYLKYYENQSYEEIAAVMGLKRQAVANYLQYGLSKLKLLYLEQTAILITILFSL